MGPRRTHTKSRTGCQSCKLRKVKPANLGLEPNQKCDEAKPKCQNCVRHGVECNYNAPPTAASTPTTGIHTGLSPFVSEAARLNSDVNAPSMGMAEMALLHHYSTSTCYTISRHPVLQTVWQNTVPTFGFSYQFVFRGILALAALHLAHLKPELQDQYVDAAEFHHNLALQMVSGTIPQINEENGPAVYLFSTITCIIGCALPRKREDLWVSNDQILQWLSLFRGTVSIIASVNESLKSGPLAPMFALGRRRSRAWEARSTANQTFLINLRRLIEESVNDPIELKCYTDAIDDLGKSFATIFEVGSSNCETADIFIWLLRITDQFLNQLRQRTPEALVIFGYYCVILKEVEWAWWMQGFSIHIIRAIHHYLDEEHRCWLQWPMEQLGWVP
ncbi:uncharacterized protein N7496_003965 [Penicillium cataractarum]|uniref:Zn(2)-C6 fungal-type domain-containing protein n=1 Tax=Penicillium cataractarum TaxID=2100454 RepID=A0A9W9VGX9_9EURO|nr:uncharacterized protein N7496_003965 [Penicillium cataractarum]KAJ5381537.1 hypothetical protein N7496_003965 [Penicillium cataractarum]